MDAAISEVPPHDPRAPQRVRYEARLRQLTVTGVRQLTPHLLRITLAGDFTGFQSPGFSDHVKLFLPDPKTGVLTLPGGDRAPSNGNAPKPIARDYTPRRYDAQAQTLDIDFALHGSGQDIGPATAWAMSAQPGDVVHVGGPRGSTLIPLAFDDYLLIGDDTAIPAIGRRLEDLPAGTRVIVMIEVASHEDRLDLPTRADARIHWVYRDCDNLNDALRRMHLPQTALHAWVACESSVAKQIRTQLLDDHGVNPRYIRAAGYWRRGDAGAHDSIED